MNNAKAKALRRVYDTHPNVQAQMSFKRFKKVYKRNTAKGSAQLKIIEGRNHGMA